MIKVTAGQKGRVNACKKEINTLTDKKNQESRVPQ